MYKVAEVEPGRHVTLTSPNRTRQSVLPWRDIEQVFNGASPESPLTPAVVDEILENPENHDSSTMCALVLAMRDPTRIRRL
jgi:hypothetical protein